MVEDERRRSRLREVVKAGENDQLFGWKGRKKKMGGSVPVAIPTARGRLERTHRARGRKVLVLLA